MQIMGQRIEGERKTRKHRNIDSLGDFDAWRCESGQREERKEREKSTGSHELSHPRRSCARFRVPPQQADLFSRLGPLSTRPLMTVNYH